MKAPRIAAINEVQKQLRAEVIKKALELNTQENEKRKKATFAFYDTVEKSPLKYFKITRRKNMRVYAGENCLELTPTTAYKKQVDKITKSEAQATIQYGPKSYDYHRIHATVAKKVNPILEKIERLRLDCLLEGEAGLSKSMATISAAISKLK